MAFALVLFPLCVAGAQQPQAPIVDQSGEPPIGGTENDGLTQAFNAAETMFNDGLATMNENTLKKAADKYEEIIENYAMDPRHFDAYFSAVYIHMEYLQTPSDYEHAKNLLTLLITKYPSRTTELTSAYLTRAHLEYRCLRDYRAAQEDLSTVLNSGSLSQELGADELDAKVLLAKCRQKLSEYEQATKIWQELLFSNPEADSEGRSQWLKNSKQWYLVNNGDLRLFFEEGVDKETYSKCLSDAVKGLDTARNMWNIVSTGPVDLFLYSSSDHLFDYTLHSKGFALPIDAEIHLSVTDIPQLPHLTGWVLAFKLNTRSDLTAFTLLRAGFSHYFMDSPEKIDSEAAREIYYYGGTIPDNELLFPLSFNYTYTEEYAALAASFVHFLIDEKRVQKGDLLNFYRLVWARNDSRWQPPLMTEILSWSGNLDFKAASTDQRTLTPDQLYGLFQNKLGVDLSGQMADWQAGLADEMAAVKTELGDLAANIKSVKVDLSTPESALQTWWDAYCSGDFDGLIASSTRDLANFLTEAKQIYIQQGILDQVIIDNFIRPNKNAQMIVDETGNFGDNLYAFRIRIVRGTEEEQMTVVVRKESGEWRIDSN